MNTIPFDASKVTRIYLGKDRYCRCGCGGEYVARGEKMFDRRLRRFEAKWAEYTPSIQPYSEDVGSNFMNISYGNNRALTAYFD